VAATSRAANDCESRRLSEIDLPESKEALEAQASFLDKPLG
jgi:hypothetical protein